MGLFGGNDYSIYLQSLNANLISIHLTFLEKERYMMGLTTAEEYKKFLEGVSNNKWRQLETIASIYGINKKEEHSNEH